MLRVESPPSGVRERQQRDHLCAPFCAARALRDIGLAVDEDELARRAQTVLPDRQVTDAVPPGAANLTGYPAGLATGPPERAGTAAAPLAEAIEAVTDGAVRCAGVHGEWSADAVQRVVEEGRALGARLLANLRTGLLWASRPPVAASLAQLEGEGAPDVAPDWDAGHFVELLALVRGPGGALVVVHDTYPTLGFDGHHLQPPAALAAALRRDDGRQGGVLAIASPQSVAPIEALAARLGLHNGMWDNGTSTIAARREAS